ncbi:pilus assembly protein [Collimonas fungivorans]|uniref:Type 4 fimbrial biogenesis protein n=1 Tax=Collimonas fungivorans (strain Ter331) TaxID=1005048 RepID=G0ACB3_COLFT|nr:PilC/PilY family type IV pilus protein [Collimonas fungivorans]AEK62468.1 type 4 fimbrial biogenesis protein [Collimonas fungivorans Ter331]
MNRIPETLKAPHRLIHLLGVLVLGTAGAAHAQIALNDTPMFSNINVPSNVLLALSVEYPTATSRAHTDPYSSDSTFIGYFDPGKCYDYDNTAGYFAASKAAANHVCSGQWSGNFLNWATTSTIDPFRWALTGGYRAIDTTTTTVLQKAYMPTTQGREENFPVQAIIRDAEMIRGATPFSGKKWRNIYVRVYGFGTSMRISNRYDSTTISIDDTPGTFGTFVATAYTAGAKNIPASSTTDDATFDIPVLVKVCDPKAVSLEANCTRYGENIYKPTGLIQNNADKLRFAAFSYLNDSNLWRDGGVLRTRMKSVGPKTPVPGSTSLDNWQKEWDPATGIFVDNPDSADAAATGKATGSTIANSGVINYLNKFGLASQIYKVADPVSELYYAAIRYLRHAGNVPEYTNGLDATMADGFPVITNWDDPVQYACQRNFIIGIGDENTHADSNLPGSKIASWAEPAMPTSVTADVPVSGTTSSAIDVRLATNKVGALEGLGNLGEQHPTWCCGDGGSYFIAGLAYAAHTSDLRPNDFTKTVLDANGKQVTSKSFQTTATTYWLDVMERNIERPNNQYWLAAKYGGFTVPDGYSTYGNTAALAQSSWNKTGDTDRNRNLRPDNYYDAGKASLMVSSLTDAFKNINSASQFSSALAVASPVAVTDGTVSYSTQYFSANWSGDVIASALQFDASTGQAVATAAAWNARLLLEKQAAGGNGNGNGNGNGWDTQRFIATSDGGKGVPFRAANIGNAGNAAALAVAGVTTTDVVNFLRGDRSKEGNPFRQRAYLLGDIVTSKAYPVGAPDKPYADSNNPGYSSFVNAQKNRSTVVYVGANDGMLHAFDGGLSGGKELFAYVPSFLYQGPTATPAVNGLASLTSATYIHHFFVDATPLVTDVDFGRAGAANSSADWRSLLIGGLGKGGKGYYALDVTNPDTLSDETNLAKAVLWEFTDATMGYSYGPPVVVKTAKYGWVVILTSGYNNADGKGYFYIVNPSNGKLLEPPIPTGAGSVSASAGLAQATAYIGDYTDYTADAVYAGDLLGNVWRLDLTKTTGTAYDAPTQIALLTDSSSTAAVQPVTTRPLIEVDKNSLKRYVLIGTGKLLADSDIKSSQQQTFYAINDGTGSHFDTSASLPTVVGKYPITRANLNNDTNVINGIGATPQKPSGWYIDLGQNANHIAQRVTSQAATNGGIVSFAANLPDGDVCTPSGSNDNYAVSYGTGKSQYSDQPFVTTAGLNNGIYFANVNGKVKVVTSNTDGKSKLNDPAASLNNPFNRLNWRQIPVEN